MTRQIHASFLSQSALSFVLRFGGIGLQLAGAVLTARLIGVLGYGTYASAYLWSVILGTLAGLGLGQKLIRDIPRLIQRGDQDAIHHHFRQLIVLMGFGFALTLAGLGALDLAGVMPFGLPSLLIAGGAILHATTLALSYAISAFGRTLQAQVIESGLKPLLTVAMLLGLFTLDAAPGAAVIFACNLGIALLAVLAMIGVLRRLLPKATHTATKIDLVHLGTTQRAALPFLFVALLGLLMGNIDFLVLSFLANPEDIGPYRAAARAAEVLTIGTAVFLQMLEPALSRAIATRDEVSQHRLIAQTSRLVIAFTLVAASFLALVSRPYLLAFGPEFLAAQNALLILLVGQVLAALCGPSSVILALSGGEHRLWRLSGAALAVNAALAIILVPSLGATGASLAATCALSLLRASLWLIARRISSAKVGLAALSLPRPGLRPATTQRTA